MYNRRDTSFVAGDLDACILGPRLFCFFLSTHNPWKVAFVQLRKSKKLYYVTVEFQNGLTRNVKVKAKDRETAENRALKFYPNAKGVKRDA